MFTGLVMAMGDVVAREVRGPGARLRIRARLQGEPLALGESIAIDGCCLSVAARVEGGFEVDATAETLARTTLGRLALGSSVNLERSIAAGERLGGHLVAGHVDACGELVERRAVGEAVAMSFTLPPEIARFVAKKGSVAVNGVSLTVNAVSDPRFEVMLIPITLGATTLGRLQPGAPVNLEADLVARYVGRFLEASDPRAADRAP